MSSSLYPGERLEVVEGWPTVFRYQPSVELTPGGPSKPILVFVPGGGNSARIAYGGHGNSRSEDFLAHWLNAFSYSMIAISYPLEMQCNLVRAAYPEFNIKDWADQISGAVLKVLREEDMTSRDVVFILWSMAGRLVAPLVKAAKSRSLDVKHIVCLAATPAGFTGARSVPTGIIRTDANYVDYKGMREGFLAQLAEQNRLNADRTIIDPDVYNREYFGCIPVGLTGFGLRYEKDQGIVADEAGLLTDYVPSAEDFIDIPMIANIHGDMPTDMRHVLADKAMWSTFLTSKLIAQVRQNGPWQSYTPEWRKVMESVHNLPRYLSTTLEGNHFFFVGEKGAKNTAEAIDRLIARMDEAETTFAKVLQQNKGREL